MNALSTIKSERMSRMGLLNEPAGYVDGTNLYEYVGSNPTNNLDPLGLYKIVWGPGWTDAEKKKVQDSLDRVNTRAGDILKEIDDALNNENCQPVKDKLNKLRDLINKLKNGLAGNDALDFTKNDWGNQDAPLRHVDDWGRNTVEFNPNAKTRWDTLKDSDLDSQMFHELTHEYGTDDGEAGDDFNNAHTIDNLMNGPLSKWTPLSFLRMQNKCECAKK